MQCPGCGSLKSSVLDSRYKPHIKQKRRRRKCRQCDREFTTFEKVSNTPGQLPRVIKRDGRREPFNRGKLSRGVLLAVAKRPISTERVDDLVDQVAERLASTGNKEVEAESVGEVVMQELGRLDRVAYIRFASVYRNFKDAGAFREEAETVERSARSRVFDTQRDFAFVEGGRVNGSGQDDES